VESVNLKIGVLKKSISPDIDKKSQHKYDDVESQEEDDDNETGENEPYIDGEEN
jgi:hypothetical protein